MISIQVDDFLFVAKYQKLLNQIKKKLKKEYNVKDLGNIKMIIEWQMTQNVSAMKIDQLVFICNFVEDKSM